ncbi:hypothetical protein PHJA_000781700 [Phtheirospermum japonicum]|uniref:Uncharacterized protein n=1 Tax=Phtheirospermum japonicum TaxID=374723 RepID=A0A830BLN0_9LAMI|nr:hypothetical protein PHJA_000781700 [Phtheirospermum japonicum]
MGHRYNFIVRPRMTILDIIYINMNLVGLFALTFGRVQCSFVISGGVTKKIELLRFSIGRPQEYVMITYANGTSEKIK